VVDVLTVQGAQTLHCELLFKIFEYLYFALIQLLLEFLIIILIFIVFFLLFLLLYLLSLIIKLNAFLLFTEGLGAFDGGLGRSLRPVLSQVNSCWQCLVFLLLHLRLLVGSCREETLEGPDLRVLPLDNLGAEGADLVVHLLLLLLDLDNLLQLLVIVEVGLNVGFIVGSHHEIGTEICPQELLVAIALVDLNQQEDKEEIHRLQDEVIQILYI